MDRKRIIRCFRAIHIILLYLAVIVAIVRHDLIERLEQFICGSPVTSDYYQGMVASQKNQNPANCVVFIGDSIASGLDVNAVAEGPALNYGIGDNTVGVLWRLSKYSNLKSAKAIVISVGINDLPRLSDEEIISNFKKILNATPINVPVIISCILPVQEQMAPRAKISYLTGYKVENSRIRRINKRIQELSRQYQNISAIDAFDLMCDKETGNLRKDFTIEGVHLSAQGYRQWADFLKSSLSQVLKNQ
jgi:lysophospholipase L1-like esterase